MKKAFCVLGLALCLLLSGCCVRHEWHSATCTAPKTCAKCGKSEGEAAGHRWREASWQQPRTCTVCGATEGAALTPAFVEHGLLCALVPGEAEDYRACCTDDPSRLTTGRAVITDAGRFKPARSGAFPQATGYTWYAVRLEIEFSDANANGYGVDVGLCLEDYYDIRLHDDSQVYDEATGAVAYTVHWNGADYDKCLYRTEAAFTPWVGAACRYQAAVYLRLPTGYDGAVVGLYNRQRDAGAAWAEGTYIYDYADADSLFFRLIP